MQTLFIHTGLHKTGTTVIQKFLHDNAPILANQGVYRPKTGLIPDAAFNNGHHELAWSLKKENVNKTWNSLLNEIDTHPAAIISSEEFEFVREYELYAPIKKIFSGWHIRLICYLRRQDEMLESEYNQHIKDACGTLSIQEFAKKLINRLDYTIYLGILENNFGRENITVRLYNRDTLKGDIFSDFLDALELNEMNSYKRPIGAVNPSLNSRGLEVMRLLNRRFAANSQKLQRLRQLVVKRYRADAFTKHQVLTDAERTELMKRYEKCNRFLAATYFDQLEGVLF